MFRRTLLACLFLVPLTAAFQNCQPRESPVAAAAEIQVSAAQFASYINELSEPEGYFDTHNFISNETSYLHVIPELNRIVRPGSVYLGVGPDQNFSYIVHTRPALAIITDIRRQNLLEHLLYKAIFDLSTTRADYLARLFSRAMPLAGSPGTRTSLQDLLLSVRKTRSSEAIYQANVEMIHDRLLHRFNLKLDTDDLKQIDYVYQTFYEEGLDLRFSSIGRNNAMNYPTLESLLLQTDTSGKLQGYLATEEMFQWLKRFETENRLVPIVGDFAGPVALKAVGSFLKSKGLRVSVFYTSNVEYYLFENGQWPDYVDNLRALPLADDAVFIRAYFSNAGGVHPKAVPGHRSTTLVDGMNGLLRDVAAGRIRSYWDVVRR